MSAIITYDKDNHLCSRCKHKSSYKTHKNMDEYNSLMDKLFINCSTFRKCYEEVILKYQDIKIRTHSIFKYSIWNCSDCKGSTKSSYQLLTIYLTYLYFLYWNQRIDILNAEFNIINDIIDIKKIPIDKNFQIFPNKIILKKTLNDSRFSINVIYYHLKYMINNLNNKIYNKYIVIDELNMQKSNKQIFKGIYIDEVIDIKNKNNLFNIEMIEVIKSKKMFDIKRKHNYLTFGSITYIKHFYKLLDMLWFITYYNEISTNYNEISNNIYSSSPNSEIPTITHNINCDDDNNIIILTSSKLSKPQPSTSQTLLNDELINDDLNKELLNKYNDLKIKNIKFIEKIKDLTSQLQYLKNKHEMDQSLLKVFYMNQLKKNNKNTKEYQIKNNKHNNMHLNDNNMHLNDNKTFSRNVIYDPIFNSNDQEYKEPTQRT
jgi:hypothetical protein